MRLSVRAFLHRLERFGRLLEDSALVALLSGMILLATVQILMRNSELFRNFVTTYFHTNLVWGDELLKIMVLWVAMLGAVAASRDDKQISIDILSRFLSPRLRLGAQVLVDFFTALVAGAIAWFSASFVYGTYAYEEVALGRLPAWIFQFVLPLAFTLIAYRYTLFFLQRLLALSTGRVPP